MPSYRRFGSRGCGEIRRRRLLRGVPGPDATDLFGGCAVTRCGGRLWQSRNVARKVVQGPHLTARPGVEGYTMPPFPDGSLTRKAPTYMVGAFILNPGVSPGTRVAWRTLSGRRPDDEPQ
jgi:hypothetical protein